MRYLNPVYKIGLKQSARTKKTVVLLLVYNFLLAGLGLLVFYLTFDREGRMRENIAYSGILTLYCVMAAMEFVMILLIVPASTAGAVAGEREKQTLDILLSTKITPFHIVTGKLAASISMVILLAVSSMPVSYGGLYRQYRDFLFCLLPQDYDGNRMCISGNACRGFPPAGLAVFL